MAEENMHWVFLAMKVRQQVTWTSIAYLQIQFLAGTWGSVNKNKLNNMLRPINSQTEGGRMG